jgi:hypothetical protein
MDELTPAWCKPYSEWRTIEGEGENALTKRKEGIEMVGR